jgi:CMP-N,N'-diacetyllegionaminic acid synthase
MSRRIIGIIPARGGSKSLPRKNLQNLLGVPLIAFSIQSALESKLIDSVYVSSDDPEILDISQRFGAHVIQRPKEISGDLSRDNELLEHAIDSEFSALNDDSLIAFLRPSHPLRNPETLDRAIEIFQGSIGFHSLRSMKETSEIPFKMWMINENGQAIKVTDNQSINVLDPSNAPRQILPKTYYQDGYIEVFPFKTVLSFRNTAGTTVLPFIIDEFSHDIDTIGDFNLISERLNKLPKPDWLNIPAIKK